MGFTDLFGGESKSQREQHQSESGWDSGRYRQFLNDINSTIGGPLSIGDFLRLAPRTQSLFGGDNPMLAGQNRPGGGFNLGFGPPPGYAGSPGVTGGTPAPAPGGGTPPLFTQADILPAWNDDPQKKMDVPRLFRESGLDPNGFTLPDFQNAVSKAGNFGFSSRSQGNFSKALSLLQGAGASSGKFGGGKGTGIF